MKRVFILNQAAYAVENGTLKKLGAADSLEHITGDVFKSSHETFVIKGNKISVLSEDAYPMRVNQMVETYVPQEIRDLQSDYQMSAGFSLKKSQNDGALYKKFFGMVSQFSQKDFENLAQNAVVLCKDGNARLFIRNKAGDYVEEKDIISVSQDVKFEQRPIFIYRGGLYVRNVKYLSFLRIDLKPLIMATRYMIFWGGGKTLFAMTLDDDVINFRVLGPFDCLIKTNVNQLIKLGNDIDGYVIYHMGQKLEKVVSFESYEQCLIDRKDGRITYHYDFTMEGVDYPQTKNYKLINGFYRPEV